MNKNGKQQELQVTEENTGGWLSGNRQGKKRKVREIKGCKVQRKKLMSHEYEVYNTGNTVKSYCLCKVTDCNQTYCGDHSEMYRRPIMLQKQTYLQKRRFVVTGDGGQGEAELDEGSERYKISVMR